MLSTAISHHLFTQFDAHRIIEEMDRNELEMRILEHTEQEIGATWPKIAAFGVGCAGITVASSRMVGCDSKIVMGGISAGGITIISSTMALGWWWWRRKVQTIRQLIWQMERTKAALRRKKQIYFSISMRLPPSRNPLICRACRSTVSSIECLVEETQRLNATSTWIDLYTDEMAAISSRSVENPEKLAIEEEDGAELDFEMVFETLISMFKLHASEYSRFLIIDFLENFTFLKLGNFLKICRNLRENQRKLKEIEHVALKGCQKSSENSQKSKISVKNQLEISWRQQTAMAIEAILEGLESENLDRHEVELALRRTLVIVGSDPSGKSETTENLVPKLPEIEPTEVKMFEKGEPTDVDMVFEGIPFTDMEKQSSRAAAARDVLLDGSESRLHEKSLLGELKMALEPRRSDFAKRERKALAKFYGIGEKELMKKEENAGKKEENFEGLGLGDQEDPEPYDWRKDAENSAGIHQEADNLDFLNALASRRVADDVIE